MHKQRRRNARREGFGVAKATSEAFQRRQNSAYPCARRVAFAKQDIVVAAPRPPIPQKLRSFVIGCGTSVK